MYSLSYTRHDCCLTLRGVHRACGKVGLASADKSTWCSGEQTNIKTVRYLSSRMPLEKILVIGAGLSGLALSLGLAAEGKQVEILEKRKDFSNRGATFGLNPAGIKALKELCPQVMSTLQGKGILIPQSNGIMLPWYEVRDALLEEVSKQVKITIHLGCEIEAIEKRTTSVTVNFTSERGEKESLTGDLLVGCDGVNSIVRSQVDLPSARPSGISVWRGTVVVPPGSVLEDLLEKGITPIGMNTYGNKVTFSIFNFHQTLPRTLTWVVTLKDQGALQHSSSCHPSAFVSPYIDNVDHKKYMEEIFKLSTESDLYHAVDLKTIDPETWSYHGRIIVIGDAAHAMRPASGLGGSMAFEDCVVLCRKLLKELENQEDIDRALVVFHSERLPRVSKIWKVEWETAEKAYIGNPRSSPPSDYLQWVAEGV